MVKSLKKLLNIAKSGLVFSAILASSLALGGCATPNEENRLSNYREHAPTAIIGGEKNYTPYNDHKGFPFGLIRF